MGGRPEIWHVIFPVGGCPCGRIFNVRNRFTIREQGLAPSWDLDIRGNVHQDRVAAIGGSSCDTSPH